MLLRKQKSVLHIVEKQRVIQAVDDMFGGFHRRFRESDGVLRKAHRLGTSDRGGEYFR